MSSDSPDVPKMGAESNGLGSDDLDALMEVLADHRRRYALYYLRRQDDAVTIGELARQLTGWDSDMDTSDEKYILAELHHKHLPKMEEVGVVERSGDEIRCGESDIPFDQYLDLAGEIERPR
ncbi:DUF7344 domain-containing protein [Haladaptatus caseinilyticus]|uniref:DUF7344 domain-containing protein n=1 Tax=Haladaptatus caseinilyticus TaxID=2993314 RepID=UPI00224B98BB|nr:hypothetical protein [Haladaptatus caseinilyticus]